MENETTNINAKSLHTSYPNHNDKKKIYSNNTEDQYQDSSRCGIAFCKPEWLQVFASKKCYTLVYSMVLVISSIKTTYFYGTMSTIEKNFNMSATMLGLIKSAFEVGCLLAYFFVVYFIGKGNKIRWTSCALFMLAVSSLINIVPHIIDINTENHWLRSVLHEGNATCNEPTDNYSSSQLAFYCFLAGHVVAGIGSVILKTSGFIYLDDNTRKNAFPFLFGVIGAFESLGSSIGYLFSSYFLKIFIDPNQIPTFSNKDSRWIGAWWLGWIPIAAAYFVCSGILILFPKTLPRAAMRERVLQKERKNTQISITDFMTSFIRIVKNKIVVLDILIDISAKIGFSGYGIFLPKYLEAQYGLTSSSSSLVLAIMKIVGRPIGNLSAGFILSKFKPKPRTIVKWSAVTRFVQVVIFASLIFITCPQQKMQGNWTGDNSLNLITECNVHNGCSENAKYSPVCNTEHKLYFYSPCHAGCSWKNAKNLKTYTNCSCVPNSASVTEGPCPTNCTSALLTFLFVIGIFNVVSVPVRSAKKILKFRFVKDADKSLYLGICKIVPTIFSLVSPIIYGSIIDQACLIFETTCNKTGYCLMYNVTKWRFLLNLFAASFLFLCGIIEILLWYQVKNLKMYDEDFKEDIHMNGEIKTEDQKLISK